MLNSKILMFFFLLLLHVKNALNCCSYLYRIIQEDLLGIVDALHLEDYGNILTYQK